MLVIQWRSLAQQSPTTPNGVPSTTSTTPPPCSTHTLSPASPGTVHTAAKQSTTPLQPTAPSQPALAQPPPPVLPQQRPPSSANPAVSRKRALHRLSKLTPQLPHQKPSSSSSSSLPTSHSTTSSLTHPATHHTQTDKSPLRSSPQAPTPTPSAPSKSLQSSEGIENQTGAPSSLQVRFPLRSVTRRLVVRIPLDSVHISRASPSVDSDLQPLRTSDQSVEKRLTETSSLTESQATTTNCVLPESGASETKSVAKTLLEPAQERERHRERASTPLTLLVSIKRELLRQKSQADNPTPNVSQQAESSNVNHNETTNSLLQVNTSSELSSLKQSHLTHSPSSEERGLVGDDGIWRRWTDPIIHEDSFAVNVLPYVYIDGQEEESESERP